MSSSPDTNKYAVYGTRGIGCAIGISLALCSYDVSFIGRESARFAKIKKRKSLELSYPEPKLPRKKLKSDNITSDVEQGLLERNVILLATKRTANKSVAELIAKYAMQNALVITLQNGLEASKHIIEVLHNKGRDDIVVLDSVVNLEVVEFSPGSFGWETDRADCCVAVDGTYHARLAEDRFCAALRGTGLDSYADKQFLDIATGKLLINLVNAPNTLAGCNTEVIFVTPEYRRVWGATVREARAVFHAMGVKQRGPRDKNGFLINNLEYLTAVPTFVAKIIARIKKMHGTVGGKSNMLQNLEDRIDATEIDFITGFVVAKGKELKVPTPVSSKLVELVKEANAKKQGSPQIAPDALLAAVGLDGGGSACIIS